MAPPGRLVPAPANEPSTAELRKPGDTSALPRSSNDAGSSDGTSDRQPGRAIASPAPIRIVPTPSSPKGRWLSRSANRTVTVARYASAQAISFDRLTRSASIPPITRHSPSPRARPPSTPATVPTFPPFCTT
nr:hypothetical protein [Kibdelosporangium phytohabitans]